jgi:DNA repair exonuclease SbcCD nuclease subunit
MPVRILCTGDIHIGRQTSKTRVPYRTADAWTAVVNLAIAQQVDVLAVSGDLIDKDGKHYEAFGPIALGLERLAGAGIETVAITGNHDWDVLARIARQPGMERFNLIGVGGQWQRHTVLRNGQPLLHVDGWSFDKEHVRISPMTSYRSQEADGMPVLGMLHADVGSTTSSYAPAQLAQFWGHDPKFWLLGHIHVPQVFAGPGDTGALYPGSPYAMDPGETGVHGAWLLTLDTNGFEPPRQIPLSPVRYETVAVDLSPVSDEDGLIATLHGAIRDAGQQAIAAQPGGQLQEVSLRLHLTGACSAHKHIGRWANQFRLDSESVVIDSVTVSLDKITVAVTPPVNLAALAEGNDPVAETAKLLLALDLPEPAPEYAELLRRTRASLGAIHADANFAMLPPSDALDEHTRALLRDQGWKLLSALIATRENA